MQEDNVCPYRWIPQTVWLYRLVRWTLSGLFIWAGGAKLANPEAFGLIIGDFGLVPEWSIVPLALILPVLEILAGLGLIFDLPYSLGGMTALLLLFIAVLGYGLWLGLDIDCGCFGPGDPESGVYGSLGSALYRDLAMGAGILFLYWCRFRRSISV
jgi:hypothetical protein